MLETPRLRGDKHTLKQNEELCRSFIQSLSSDENISYEYDENTKAHIWRKVPKKAVVDLVRGFSTHPWNLNFQPIALADYISDDEDNTVFEASLYGNNLTFVFHAISKIYDTRISGVEYLISLQGVIV